MLHNEHLVGEECLHAWLQTRNTCPACKVALFREELAMDDRTTLRRVRSLQLHQQHFANAGNREMKAKMYGMWRALVDARADAFTRGEVEAPESGYTVYRGRAHSPESTNPYGKRIIDADVLVHQLDQLWDHLFMQASGSATRSRSDSVVGVENKLTVPCHPLAAKLRQQMAEIIRKNHGSVVAPNVVRMELNGRWIQSELWKQWNALDQEAPQGLFIYQAHLVEAVVAAVMELPVVADVRAVDDGEDNAGSSSHGPADRPADRAPCNYGRANRQSRGHERGGKESRGPGRTNRQSQGHERVDGESHSQRRRDVRRASPSSVVVNW